MSEKDLKKLKGLLQQFEIVAHPNYKQDIEDIIQYVSGAIASKKFGSD